MKRVLLRRASTFFCLKDSNYFCKCWTFSGVAVPTFSNYLPRTIREFWVFWSIRSTPFQDRIHPRHDAPVVERAPTIENLVPAPFQSVVHTLEAESSILTSQATRANAKVSLDIVGPVLVSPRRRGLMSSGASAPWNDRSTSAADEEDGTKAIPKPPIRGRPSWPTRIFV